MTVIRYSNEELNEFRQLVESKLEETLREYNSIIWQMHVDNSSYQVVSDNVVFKEDLYVQAARLKRHVDNLRSALLRLENKTYGICIISGTLIPKQRLLAVPHTTINTEARLQPVRIGA